MLIFFALPRNMFTFLDSLIYYCTLAPKIYYKRNNLNIICGMFKVFQEKLKDHCKTRSTPINLWLFLVLQYNFKTTFSGFVQCLKDMWFLLQCVKNAPLLCHRTKIPDKCKSHEWKKIMPAIYFTHSIFHMK